MTTHRLLSPRDFRRMPWRNGLGHTAEIASCPPDGAGGAFAWRASLADIERDGPFSSFPGVDRTLVVVDGEGVVLTQDDASVELRALGEPFRFDGERGCACRLIGGPARAFNLMVRRGDARGRVVVADGAPVAAGPIRFGVCYAARGASECLLPGRAPIPVESGHALVVDGEAQSTSMHVNPIDPGAVAIVATLDANGRAADAR